MAIFQKVDAQLFQSTNLIKVETCVPSFHKLQILLNSSILLHLAVSILKIHKILLHKKWRKILRKLKNREQTTYLECVCVRFCLQEHGADLHLEHNSTSFMARGADGSNGEIVSKMW